MKAEKKMFNPPPFPYPDFQIFAGHFTPLFLKRLKLVLWKKCESNSVTRGGARVTSSQSGERGPKNTEYRGKIL